MITQSWNIPVKCTQHTDLSESAREHVLTSELVFRSPKLHRVPGFRLRCLPSPRPLSFTSWEKLAPLRSLGHETARCQGSDHESGLWVCLKIGGCSFCFLLKGTHSEKTMCTYGFMDKWVCLSSFDARETKRLLWWLERATTVWYSFHAVFEKHASPVFL